MEQITTDAANAVSTAKNLDDLKKIPGVGTVTVDNMIVPVYVLFKAA